MKVGMCDLCLSERKFVASKYRSGYKGGYKIDVCEEHKGWAKKRNLTSREEFERAAVDITFQGERFVHGL
jgi:hypothetical protein